ncbi:IS1 transposase orfB [Shigella boydii CDC 3083-94]|nr:IS1 transposase orfB [Shigella boydii CDC 3083-94]SPZ87159.1 IS1 transposase orfB [Shigella boydii]
MSRQCTHYGRWPQHGFTSLKKLRPQSVTSRIQPGSDVIVCAEMDEQWGYVGAKSRQRWLFYAYDRIRRTVVAHVFGERTLATLERLLSLLSAFEVVVWMTDGWPLYESRLKGKLHVISKRYTQRIERHNLNLRQHLARLGRKSLSFSKSVELHDKVIGHYLTISKLESLPIFVPIYRLSLVHIPPVWPELRAFARRVSRYHLQTHYFALPVVGNSLYVRH